MRLLRPRWGKLRPIDELERSLRVRLDRDASRQVLDGVLASEDVIGAFVDAEALARALAALPRRRPAVAARPMPRLAFATIVLACTMSVGTAFAQDLPAIAQLAVARVVALIDGPVPIQAAADAPLASAPWRETPATNPRAPEPVSPPMPASAEIEPEPELPAPSAALEPTPAADPAEAVVEPPPAQPERAPEERVSADEPLPVPDRAGPPKLPDGAVFEELEPVVGPAPVVESSPALPDAAAEPESPRLPEAPTEPPVVVEEPDAPAEEPVDEEPVDEEPVDEEPVDEEPDESVDEEEPAEETEDETDEEQSDDESDDEDEEEPGDDEPEDEECEDRANEHAHEHADENAAIHDCARGNQDD